MVRGRDQKRADPAWAAVRGADRDAEPVRRAARSRAGAAASAASRAAARASGRAAAGWPAAAADAQARGRGRASGPSVAAAAVRARDSRAAAAGRARAGPVAGAPRRAAVPDADSPVRPMADPAEDAARERRARKQPAADQHDAAALAAARAHDAGAVPALRAPTTPDPHRRHARAGPLAELDVGPWHRARFHLDQHRAGRGDSPCAAASSVPLAAAVRFQMAPIQPPAPLQERRARRIDHDRGRAVLSSPRVSWPPARRQWASPGARSRSWRAWRVRLSSWSRRSRWAVGSRGAGGSRPCHRRSVRLDAACWRHRRKRSCSGRACRENERSFGGPIRGQRGSYSVNGRVMRARETRVFRVGPTDFRKLIVVARTGRYKIDRANRADPASGHLRSFTIHPEASVQNRSTRARQPS